MEPESINTVENKFVAQNLGKQSAKLKMVSSINPDTMAYKESDLHEKEALGHGIFFIRSRLEEGQRNFQQIKVIITTKFNL